MTQITNEEKISVLVSHKKNCQLNAYNLSISLLEENVKANPDPDAIARIEAQDVDIANQIMAIDAEIAAITPVTP